MISTEDLAKYINNTFHVDNIEDWSTFVAFVQLMRNQGSIKRLVKIADDWNLYMANDPILNEKAIKFLKESQNGN